jgi:uncharacterized metal-binding protein
MSAESKGCGCGCSGGGPKLVFACSGAADVGAIADQAARKLTRDGAGKMYCMAGLGGDVASIIETTKKACAILAIDGCPVDCVKHTLERLGFGGYSHLRVTDLGMQKGSSPATEENIAKVVGKGAKMLA